MKLKLHLQSYMQDLAMPTQQAGIQLVQYQQHYRSWQIVHHSYDKQ